MAELKDAGIGRKEARGVGIVVDHRRRSLSEEGKKLNVERLVAYKQKLIVFPRKAGKPKKGDSSVSSVGTNVLHARSEVTSFRQRIFPQQPLVSPSPFLNHSLLKHLAKLLPRSVNLKPTKVYVPLALMLDMRVLARLVLLRLVQKLLTPAIPHIFLHLIQKEEEEAAKKK